MWVPSPELVSESGQRPFGDAVNVNTLHLSGVPSGSPLGKRGRVARALSWTLAALFLPAYAILRFARAPIDLSPELIAIWLGAAVVGGLVAYAARPGWVALRTWWRSRKATRGPAHEGVVEHVLGGGPAVRTEGIVGEPSVADRHVLLRRFVVRLDDGRRVLVEPGAAFVKAEGVTVTVDRGDRVRLRGPLRAEAVPLPAEAAGQGYRDAEVLSWVCEGTRKAPLFLEPLAPAPSPTPRARVEVVETESVETEASASARPRERVA
ncbi:MAG TPA: hypothetical protein RMH85_00035 [Polyangiaceae bacterium LLY-WYZ-15_(1-7)]|nr:hypothetical protein [Sandaracinus sp.]HJK95421.1 hypothetical protein [Polyangiaceae bacterium LLY-WYZ-15_(1-7)]MBJ73181.1 hypothetical protein [Sandaracinus sp.]HJL00294.1 hypothetical protein [Polyangiaceae bacterium LLY-WYZ-15_(1-7)]HJL06846.1 hypothetical protein [Polyangiaceae bacterium LLY-WYZ-15_(1-7)]